MITGNSVHDNNNKAGIAIYPAGQWGPAGGYTYNGLTTHDNDVIGNTVSGLGSNNGIVLNTATYTTVTNNTALSGLSRGIYIEAANTNGNLIYFNAFKGNRNQISRVGSSNTWNSTSPQNYTYNGGNYTGYIGNYWSDYSGIDPDGNGIGTPAYDLGDESDNYPLRQGITAYSPGDFNNDGVVDAADYVVWRKGLGTTFTQSDYDVWRANFGRTLSGSASTGDPSKGVAAVPEPNNTSLIATGALILGTMLALKPRKGLLRAVPKEGYSMLARPGSLRFLLLAAAVSLIVGSAPAPSVQAAIVVTDVTTTWVVRSNEAFR